MKSSAIFTPLLLASVLAAPLISTTEPAALEAVLGNNPRDTALVIFTKPDGTLWIGLPFGVEAEQLVLDVDTLTQKDSGRALAVDSDNNLVLGGATQSPFKLINGELILNSNSSAIACPSKDGLKLEWGQESVCPNGRAVNLFPSQHILKQPRSFFDNSEALNGEEPALLSSVLGIDIQKRDVDGDLAKRDGMQYWTPPGSYYYPNSGCGYPPQYYPPPRKCDCEDHDECSGCLDVPCNMVHNSCKAWNELLSGTLDSVKVFCPSTYCNNLHKSSPKSCETQCRDPGCYCQQDPRYYYYYQWQQQHGQVPPYYPYQA